MSFTIGVGTDNPVKIRGIERAFSKFFSNFKMLYKDVDNVVGPQPIGYKEIFKGAYYRSQNIRKIYPHIKYSVGIEAGIVNHSDRYYALQACCIIIKNKDTFYGLSPGFELPRNIASIVLEGRVVELGEAVEKATGVEDAGRQGGLIGIMSGGVVDREELSYLATLMALISINWYIKHK